MSLPLRTAYRAILWLHPVDFRAEFGDEMLWIFDEESRHGHALHLLLDGLRSCAVQSVRPRQQQAETAGSLYVELDSSLPSERYAQIALTFMFCSLSIILFVSMLMPRAAVPLGGRLIKSIRFLAESPAPAIAHPQRHAAKRFAQ